jgi:Uma2 family endonuclease
MAGNSARTLDPEYPNLDTAVVEGYRNAPEHLIAEVIGGQLSLMPRPRLGHSRSSSRLGAGLAGFDNPRGDGPGGWLILDEPEVHLGPLPDILVPDLAGWRREHISSGFTQQAFATLAPDWVCEVLSPSTEARDRNEKLAIYHREGVGHAWLVSPSLRTLEVYRRHDLGWLRVGTFTGPVEVRAEPFDAVALDLGALWEE